MARLTKTAFLVAIMALSLLSLGFYQNTPHPNSILIEFINDLKSGEEARLNPWFGDSGLDTGRDILTSRYIKYVDVLFPPVITDNQIAAIIIVWDDQIQAYKNYSVFFRKSGGSCELYGLFPDRDWEGISNKSGGST